MEKTSVRLTPETSKKLQAEARKLSELTGKTVTVSDLLRACVGEKFPEISARVRREVALLTEVQEEVVRLGKRMEKFTEEVGKISTRQQVDDLQEALVRVLEATSRR